MLGIDEYERGVCAQCGAKTLDEAETVCRPINTPSGDDQCGHPEDDWDDDGFCLVPTAGALKRLNEWVDAELRRMEEGPSQHGTTGRGEIPGGDKIDPSTPSHLTGEGR